MGGGSDFGQEFLPAKGNRTADTTPHVFFRCLREMTGPAKGLQPVQVEGVLRGVQVQSCYMIDFEPSSSTAALAEILVSSQNRPANSRPSNLV